MDRNSARRLLGPFGVDRLLRLPGDLAAALEVVPAIAEHTASLHEMTRTLGSISGDTDALPPLRADMAKVAEATSVLSEVDARLKTISEAMPVLVEVQRHLDQLLPAMEALGGDVAALRDEIGPVSRLASRVPGQRQNKMTTQGNSEGGRDVRSTDQTNARH